MEKYLFFKPTQIYKEFIILDMIEKNNKITQREIAELINSVVSRVNTYIDRFESYGYIKRIRISKKCKYLITKKE